MNFEYSEIGQNLVEVKLNGRLDIQGAESIDIPFKALTNKGKAGVLVNMSGVDFIASIGIRTLLSNAKALALHGGKMILLNPVPMVKDVLKTSGINNIIPVMDDYDNAVHDLEAAL